MCVCVCVVDGECWCRGGDEGPFLLEDADAACVCVCICLAGACADASGARGGALAPLLL